MKLYVPWTEHEGERETPIRVKDWLLAFFALMVFVIFMFGAIAASHSQERHLGSGGHRGGEHGFSGHPRGSEGHPGVWGHPHGGGSSWGHRNDEPLGGLLGGIIGGWLWNQFNQPPPPAE